MRVCVNERERSWLLIEVEMAVPDNWIIARASAREFGPPQGQRRRLH